MSGTDVMRDGRTENDEASDSGRRIPGADRSSTGEGSSIGAVGGWWDEPAEWAFTIFKAGDLRVRTHVLFLAFAILLFARAAWPRPGDPPISDVPFAAIGVAAVLLAVIWHEIGHAVGYRLIGGQLYEIVIWPLGGLDTARPNRRWFGRFIAALCGPMVNLIAAGVLTAVLLSAGQKPEHVLFNPLIPWDTYAIWSLSSPSGLLVCLWWLNYANLMVGVCNLLPVYPLDGADLLSSLIWARSNQRRAIEVTSIIGYIGSAAALVIGLGTAIPVLVACALFCWFVCWQNRRRLAFLEGIDPPTELIDVAPHPEQSVPTAAPAIRSADEPEPAASDSDDESVVDAVLAKVSDQGIDSLTASERAILQRATDRRRAGRWEGRNGH